MSIAFLGWGKAQNLGWVISNHLWRLVVCADSVWNWAHWKVFVTCPAIFSMISLGRTLKKQNFIRLCRYIIKAFLLLDSQLSWVQHRFVFWKHWTLRLFLDRIALIIAITLFVDKYLLELSHIELFAHAELGFARNDICFVLFSCGSIRGIGVTYDILAIAYTSQSGILMPFWSCEFVFTWLWAHTSNFWVLRSFRTYTICIKTYKMTLIIVL